MNTIEAGDLVRLTDKARKSYLYPPSMKGDMLADKRYIISDGFNGRVCVDVLCEDGNIRLAEVDDLEKVS